MGQESRLGLAGRLCLRCSQEATVKLSAGRQSPEARLSRRIHFQAHSCKSLAGGPSSSPRGLCTAAPDMASPRASGLGGRTLKRKATDFCNLILEVINHQFYHIVLVTQGCGYQRAGIIVGHLGGWPLWVPLTSFSGNHGLG